MNDLDRSIVATLAYYGSFSWPLTAIEVWTRLIPAARLGGRTTQVSPGEVVERLEVLVKIGAVTTCDGLYTLGAVDVASRVSREKECAQKWRRMRRAAWWLQAVPYVRALMASGSLALGNTGPESDWDVFVVAQAGRLYTARLGLLVVARLMGRLRVKTDRSAPDKFCFNHYLTTDALTLQHRSLYVAQGLVALTPIFNHYHYREQLWSANEWMSQYVPMPTSGEFVRRDIRYSPLLNGLRRGLESVLDTVVGSVVERIIVSWMQRRIRRTPATHQPGGRVTADAHELEFHPRSFEATALERYNSTLARLGLGQFAESDSGLTR